MAHARPIPQFPWGWRSMWVIAMFDLPTFTPQERKAYARFRKDLIEDGFTMMQYSVYSRHCASIENAEVHAKRMGAKVPAAGEVRFMIITDKQFDRIRVYVGKKRQPAPPSPSQMELF
ncbi:MAG: CRISPR-associated endonuclease Cas2 [Magnetospirillum sp.]|nr:CRISPR-associated endonuclease Cas2 [Magnetospirillum sp.]